MRGNYESRRTIKENFAPTKNHSCFIVCISALFGIFLFAFFTKMSEMNSVIKQLQDIDFAQIEDAMKNVNKILHYFN